MILFILTLFMFQAKANAPQHWQHILEVTEQHEFYKNNELISSPKDAWQTLFGLKYMTRDQKILKDCLYYRVPGNEEGILKIISMDASEKCDESILKKGDREIAEVKTLQFFIEDKKFQIDYSLKDFSSHKWAGAFQKKPSKNPSMNMSSAEFKSPEIIFVAPASDKKTRPAEPLTDGFLCHNVNEDCVEVSPSVCSACPKGWYEIPTGCPQSPKYCGEIRCGVKNAPACRRGMKWQRKEMEFDCRIDSSFAYCSPGLEVKCEGKKAYCN
jgi:hypothetical protein